MDITAQKNLRKIIASLREGKVLALPTDTVYGLISIAGTKTKQRIYAIKKRPTHKPLPLFVGSIAAAKKIAHIDTNVEQFLKSIWPGKVTVVLKSKKNIPGFSENTVALRVPNHSLLLKILENIPRPLTGTSANISSEKPTTSHRVLLQQFASKKNRPDIIVTTKRPKRGRHDSSTIVDLTGKRLKLVRRGPVSVASLQSMWASVKK